MFWVENFGISTGCAFENLSGQAFCRRKVRISGNPHG